MCILATILTAKGKYGLALFTYCLDLFFLLIFTRFVLISFSSQGYMCPYACASLPRPEATIKALNEDLRAFLHISTEHVSKSHMWNAATLPLYLEFLGGEVRRRRQELGLSFEHKALVLADKAAVHGSLTFARVREQFEERFNCIFIHGHSTQHGLCIPGGWGATGGPNDGFHQAFHSIRRSYHRVTTRQGCSSLLRRAMQDIDVSVDGNSHFTYLGKYFIIYIYM